MIKYILKFIPLVLSTIITFCTLFSASGERLEIEIPEQRERIAALEKAYNDGEIEPVNESVFFDGDLYAALENGLKFNELRYIATHNSYQTEAVDELKKVYGNLSELTFGAVAGNKADFVSETITDQLNCGIYSLELDIETFEREGEISFTCMHSPNIDMTTSCYDFSLTLKEISMWSDNNPNHLPITIIIEPKETFIPLKDMKFFNLEYAQAFDKALRNGLGDKLFTPNDMLGDYENFAQLRADDGWCEVKDMLGKVLILLHDCNVTESYLKSDSTLRTQAMFPMMEDKDADNVNASFLLINNPDEALELSEEIIKNGKFIVRTRADKFTSVTEERREQAFACGAQIISTDYPVRTYTQPDDYVVSFEGYKTIKPNK